MPKREGLDGEFVFGEGGGKGVSASQYFRKISSRAQGVGLTIPDGHQQPVGAGRSHAEQHLVAGKAVGAKSGSLKIASSKKSSKSPVKSKHHTLSGSAGSTKSSTSKSSKHNSNPNTNADYFDLDDDWDSTFESDNGRAHPHNLHSVRLAGNSVVVKDERSELAARAERDALNQQIGRIVKFQNALSLPTVDLEHLRNIAWGGVPADLRPQTWMHLLGYLPPTAERRQRTLERKRKEYFQAVEQAFSTPESLDQAMWHQISIDIPRTNPHIKLYSYPATQRSLERILYLWAVRHPASGYVQGINDLVTPFFQTFLAGYAGTRVIEETDPLQLVSNEQLAEVEADSYWCLSKLLDGIQDNYIHAQPGIHRQISLLERLMEKIDMDLVLHLKSEGVEFMQFSFRWMNCLLMREVPMACTIRIWDTYLAEGLQNFSEFHVYLCAAVLAKFSPQLRKMDFQDLMIFLQSLPTQQWGEADVELLISSAYMYQSLFRLHT